MAEERYTAEKDLLKIIENPESAQSKPQEAPGSKAVSAKRGKFNLGKSGSGGKAINLRDLLGNRKAVIQVLLIAAVCVFVFFLVNIFTEYGRLKKAKQIVVREEKVEEMEVPAGALNIEESVERSESLRNIFKPYEKKVVAEKTEKPAASLENYKLVGISVEPDSKKSYAMVENIKTNAVIFLKKGEKLEGMELEDILENKLTLKLEGQTIELR